MVYAKSKTIPVEKIPDINVSALRKGSIEEAKLKVFQSFLTKL